MKHYMTLQPEPFELIKSGKKTIELRLYDEKRQGIRAGDEIEFRCTDGDMQTVRVRVIALHIFDSFAVLYSALPLEKCGYTEENLQNASPDDMSEYYSAEEQSRYGVVGIEIKLIDSKPKSLTHASKFLSLILRHKPEAVGITLDEHGWADVSELLQGIRKTHPLTIEQLEEIVRTDEKQRYSFNDDKTKIRANQGHSVNVDVELEVTEPPEFLYHGTGEKYVSGICKKGLIPRSRLYVHLSEDIETAKKVGARHGTPVVFRIKSGEMHREGFRFYRSVNGVWLTVHVPVKYLERV